jgi:uncharacterized membrane protein YuzA (DUF378 family)
MILIIIVLIGGINWGTTAMGFNIVEKINLALSRIFQKRLWVDRVIYVLVAAAAIIHEVTLRTIHPALSKGPAYRAERVAKFITSQNRVNGQQTQHSGNQSLCHSCVPSLCGNSNTSVPLRPSPGVPSPPLLPFNACPSGLSDGAE